MFLSNGLQIVGGLVDIYILLVNLLNTFQRTNCLEFEEESLYILV